MPKFAITLKDGKTVYVHAPNEEAAMAHATQVAESFKKDLYVGPKTAGSGQPDQLARQGDPEKATRKAPVVATRVK